MITETMTKEFYKQWLINNENIMLNDALYYVQGIDPKGNERKFYKKSTEWLFDRAILKCPEPYKESLKYIFGIYNHKGYKWRFIENKLIVISPIMFTMYIYQFISYFPENLFLAYKEVTGEELYLKDYSPVKFFYSQQASLDVWNFRKACYFIAHVDPSWHSWPLYSHYLPPMHTYQFIYHIIKMAKASIKAGELICIDESSKFVKPLIFLQWAIKKGVISHPFFKKTIMENAIHQKNNTLSSKYEEIKPRAREIDKIAVQAVAKTLKNFSPNMKIKDLIIHNDIQNTAAERLYEHETLRIWISGAFPKGTFPAGRPLKKTLS